MQRKNYKGRWIISLQFCIQLIFETCFLYLLQILSLNLANELPLWSHWHHYIMFAYFQTFCFMITWLAFIETICVNYLMRAMTSRSQIQAEPLTKISSLLMALKKPATWDLLTKVAFPTVFVVYAITYYSIISSAREACDSSNGVKCLY